MLLADEGRWDEAREALLRLGLASAYGDMFSATVRVCAATETGDRTQVAAENYAALQQALICTEAFDEAAALYVRRLADPTARPAALMAPQRWAPDPARLRFREKMYERLAEVRQRPEVQEALAAVGRSREIPLPLAYWGGQY